MSLEAPPGIPAAPPVAPAAPEAAAAAEGSDGQYLRLCRVCNTVSYLRQGVCLNPGCRQSYLQDTPQNVGARLQSWGNENSQETATVDQLEGARKRRQGSSWYDKQGNPKRSKGAKQRQWTQSFAEGKHPRTGVDTWTPIQRQGKWWIWTRETHWKAFDTYEEALAAKEGIYASRSPAPAEAAATPEAAKAAPTAYKSGPHCWFGPTLGKSSTSGEGICIQPDEANTGRTGVLLPWQTMGWQPVPGHQQLHGGCPSQHHQLQRLHQKLQRQQLYQKDPLLWPHHRSRLCHPGLTLWAMTRSWTTWLVPSVSTSWQLWCKDFPWLCLLPVVSLSDQPQKCMHWLLQSHHLQRHQQGLCLCQVIAQMRRKVKEAAEIKFAKQSVQSSWPV